MTCFRWQWCWWHRYVGSPTSQTFHQHIWSPTSVTNIDVTIFHRLKVKINLKFSIGFKSQVSLLDAVYKIGRTSTHWYSYGIRVQRYWTWSRINMDSDSRNTNTNFQNQTLISKSNVENKKLFHRNWVFWKKMILF